jgi:K+-transporting ATPase A subunit
MPMIRGYFGWLQLAVFMGLLLVLTRPTGAYLFRVLDGNGRMFLDPILRPLERTLYFLIRVDPRKEQSWKPYTLSMLAFSLAGVLFTSAAVGIAVAAALVRAIARQSAKTIDNFWGDLVRVNLYVLLPLCTIYAVFLVSQGMIQNFKPYDTARVLDPYVAEVSKKDAAGNLLKDAVIPADAVTASGSGLDPHTSLQNAFLQAPRVAHARGIGREALETIVHANAEGRDLGTSVNRGSMC